MHKRDTKRSRPAWNLAERRTDVQLPSERLTFMPREQFSKTPSNHELRGRQHTSSADEERSRFQKSIISRPPSGSWKTFGMFACAWRNLSSRGQLLGRVQSDPLVPTEGVAWHFRLCLVFLSLVRKALWQGVPATFTGSSVDTDSSDQQRPGRDLLQACWLPQ